MPRIEGSFIVLRDALVGIVLIAVLWLTAGPPDAASRLLQISLATVVLVAALLRSRWPASMVAASLLATCVAWVLGVTYDPFVLSGWCVLGLAARRGAGAAPWWMIVTGTMLLGMTLGISAEGIEDRMRGMLLGAVVLSAAWVVGVRTREAQIDAAARSRTEERLRLARDVHDVLSHSLGAIGVRAGIAAHVTTLGSDDLRDVLREIEADARGSLAELKMLLNRERHCGPAEKRGTGGPISSPGAADVAADTLSSPLGDVLAELARSAQHVGVRTRLEVPDGVDRLPADVRTTIHRVAQEAVTNVIRHASASCVSIVVVLLPDSVRLEIRDDGVGAGASTGTEGHGLTGIRERVALLGGTVLIDAAGIGFAMTISLPLTLADVHERSGP